MRPVGRAAIVAGVTTTLALCAVASTRTSLFHVRDIEVSGNEQLSRPEIVALSGITDRTNSIWLDEGAVEERLESSGWIAGADVAVRLPGTIRVTVRERRPVAVTVRATERFLVAEDGTLLSPVDRSRDLPMIEVPHSWVGVRRVASLSAPARVVGALPLPLRADVRRAVVAPDSTIELLLRGGLRVRLGPATDLRSKVAALRDVLAWTAAADEDLRRVDVSAPAAPAVALAG